jgi:hypothetical protein
MVKNIETSPFIQGNLIFNGHNRFAEGSDAMYWNCVQPYQSALRSPATGIHYYSFALSPFIIQPTGSANFSKISRVEYIYDVHPLIGVDNPATIEHYAMSYNKLNIISGMSGLQWQI